MAVSTDKSYTINMYAFKTQNDPPPSDHYPDHDHHPQLATLEIVISHRYRLQLRAGASDGVFDVEDVESPPFRQRVAVPSRALALRALREVCVAEALRGLVAAESGLWWALVAEIERFMAAAAAAAAEFGLLGFAAVAVVGVTTTDVGELHDIKQEQGLSSL